MWKMWNYGGLFALIFLILLRFCVSSDDCTWNVNRSASTVFCSMRSINELSALDLEMATGAKNLIINCDQTLFDESLVPANFFDSVSQSLEALTINGCKINKLANGSLSNFSTKLRSLTINTQNSKWSQSTVLEIESGSFSALAMLQLLDLSDNNIRVMPQNVICPLKNIQKINLSNNKIRVSSDLGFYSCAGSSLSELVEIDLSNNELTVLDFNWIKSDLRSVQILNLEYNNISKIFNGAFDQFTSLKKLNISYNNLETLPPQLFNQTINLQELDLHNNKLYELPSDMFITLSELIVLNLSENQLTSHYIDMAIFSSLKRLVILNLSSNALTRLDQHTFVNLNFLQMLDLKNNSIGFVDKETFWPLTNLHTLNLSGNRLHIINSELFNGLFVLSKLVLNNNLITVIETSAFRNCSSLKELDLSSNQLSDVPLAISDLFMLKSLDLGENRIIELKNDSFKNLNQLTGLRLADNLISNITCGVLYDLPKLSVLNLAKNKITSIERGSFEKNKVIEALRLDKNFLTDINGIFSTINSLLWLNLSENQLVWFDYAFIPMNLRWLDIHSNYIEALNNYYKLQYEITITTLDASHNRITELGPSAVPNSIKLFFVNNNLIRNIYPNTFVDKINLTRVDLYSNDITKLHLHAIRIAPMISKSSIPEFYLNGNPFECDCTMRWLSHRIDQLHQQIPKIMDYENIECLVSHKRETPVRRLSTLTHQDFLCRYETLCPATCHCCDLKFCHCNIKCPSNCSCFYDQIGEINKINCGKQNAFDLIEKIPIDSTELYADGNYFLELKNYAFGSLKQLKTLYLNNSNIITLQHHSFSGLNSLQKLHLEDNKLTALYGYEFNSVHNLRELYLQNNLLTHIENSTLSPLKHLQILRINGNRLSTLSIWQMQSFRFKSIKVLTLANNLWSCNCEFLQEFIPFVYDSDVLIRDADNLYCTDTGDVRRPITSNSTSLWCTEYDRVVLPEGIPHGYVPLLGFALSLLFILAILVAIFTVKEQICCIYSGNSIEKQCLSKKKYDALILSSPNDVDFVASHIVDELKQNKPTLRIALQHKNLQTGNVLKNINLSHKVIVYLSNNFLQTEWVKTEIRSAVANYWIPGRIIIIQSPNLNISSNIDRELINNIGKGIVLLRTWEIDFSIKLANAVESHPNHLIIPNNTHEIWMSGNSDPTISINYNNGHDHDYYGNKNRSYYSSAELVQIDSLSSIQCLSKSPSHLYDDIDSEYGNVTNEDSIVSIHKSLHKDTSTNSTNLNSNVNGFLV